MSDDRFSMPDLPSTEPEQQTEIPSYRPIQPIQLPEQNPALSPQQSPAQYPNTPQQQNPAQYPNNPQQQNPAQYPNTPQQQSPVQYPNNPQQQSPAQYPNNPQQQSPVQYPNTPQRPPVYQQMQQTPTPDNRPLPFSQDIMRLLSLPPITKAEAEFCRHSHEKRWFRRLTAINILLIISAIVLMISSFGEYKKTMKRFTEDVTAEMLQSISEQTGTADDDEETDEDTDEKESDDDAEEEEEKNTKDIYAELYEDLPLGYQMFFYGIAALLIGYLGLYWIHADLRSRSIRITERNFPEIYALIHSYAERLGMNVPEAYIVSESGVLNAFSAFLFRRQYIQINSEVFEVAYREHRDMNALAFIIAHEMAHIYYGHATLSYNLRIWFSQTLPIVGSTASRTREYSCDRLAQRMTNYDGLGAMFMLMVDRHLYKMVDTQDYLEQSVKDRGFFLWLVNLFSTHPIMQKRIRALAMWSGNGDLY
ncbi:MAG: M48 family metalloprotease [Oscillospiraceae bacterium]|nr:M48 family metalloprotease [Oscillospiraceae bacterium]